MVNGGVENWRGLEYAFGISEMTCPTDRYGNWTSRILICRAGMWALGMSMSVCQRSEQDLNQRSRPSFC